MLSRDVCRFNSRSGLSPFSFPLALALGSPSEWPNEDFRKFEIINKVRFWRYVRKSSFLVERRENEEGSGRMADGSGREDSEDVKELIRVDNMSGIEGFVLDIFASIC